MRQARGSDIESISNPLILQIKTKIRDEIFVDGNWVTHGAKKVLLLSHDYRAVQATSQNGVLILTHATGRVSVIELDAAELSREAQEKMEAIDTSESGNDVS